MSERKQLLLRLDPAVHEALGRWAAAELRSTTAQIEYLLRQALALAGRLPDNIGRMPRRGRPARSATVFDDAEPGDLERGDPERGDPERGDPERGDTRSSETGTPESGDER